MYCADYQKAARAAVDVLRASGIKALPTDPLAIIRPLRQSIWLKSYTNFMKMSKLSYQDTVDTLGSDQGVCLYDPTRDVYVILFNDREMNEAWARFTIAHELGHIFLGHHHLTGMERFLRSSFPDDVYTELEKEANVFARNLLSPAPLAYAVAALYKNREAAVKAIMKAFNITKAAAEVRLAYIDRDLEDYDDEMIEFTSALEMNDYGVYCSVCRRRVSPSAVCCENCGGTDFRFGRRFKKAKTSIPFDQKTGNFAICPECHNAEFSESAVYCKICGLQRENHCLGDAHHHCNWYASYCPECGAETSYYDQNLFTQMDLKGDNKMIYDGRGKVPYDPETKRIKKCPRCFNEEFSEGANYCIICGLPLYNFCDGSGNADLHNALIGKVHLNPPEARYCEICGAPTKYFRLGALPTYQDAITEKAEDLVRAGVAPDIDEGKRMLTEVGADELAKKMKPKYR